MQDVLDEDSDMSDWLVEREAKSGVVLHDRLMTDALGAVPIKTEHSYSLHSDGESVPPSPHHTKVDDMEDECYPAIPASAWRSRRRSSSPLVKAEPKSEPESPASSCPPSPSPTPTPTSASLTHLDYVIDHTTGTIHMPQAVLQQVGAAGVPQLLLSAAPRIAGSLSANKLSIKFQSAADATIVAFVVGQRGRAVAGARARTASARSARAPRAPLRLPTFTALAAAHQHAAHQLTAGNILISTQRCLKNNKGSTGTLVLTEEEKRTLLAEGYPVPTRLPLTKAEEKSLKKIRRKIKNKISAQESRRKKKEYMDQLERKVEILVSENSDYRKRVETLEQKNASLLSQLAALQALVTRTARK
ncbi:Cyclic AMP response element-binding protein A [Papilio machaon]|uniref:Cyclic AMP response element-binding protein A n=1 Tax=Papilio machaon TaxID=76193 RepID=A0A194R016_PAPMA|nr:Cyclic AMP response element-binding protein A [Papilio machaon]